MAVGRTAVVDGLGADSFELLDVVEASEHSDAVEEDCDVNDVVEEDAITTDKRLDGRPKIKTVSNK